MLPIRASGILLHITSLPNLYGIGDFGNSAYKFIDFLVATKQRFWQILPLGPTDQYNSPYAPYSAFAGNPYLISPEKLVADALVSQTHLLNAPPVLAGSAIDYPQMLAWKGDLLNRAYQNFRTGNFPNLRNDYENFCHKNSFWLADYALFMALKHRFENSSWVTWPKKLAKRDPEAIKTWRHKLELEIVYHKFTQYIFFKQWQQLKDYARKNHIHIIGDLPIFVAHDSADVWAYPTLFKLAKDGLPTVVAGVPPDYFSKTGQLWGNPQYDWPIHKEQNYKWWLKRLEMLLSLVDLVRIDHFRGFEAYWEVPFGKKTAANGVWQKGPGSEFFRVLQEHFNQLPFIAEDLGFITKEVIKLRKEWKLPGMKVLHFAFDSLNPNTHSPHNHDYNCVVYTGTHDNNTTIGWYWEATEDVQNYIKQYLNSNGMDIAWDFIRAAFSSPAKIAIIPMQDILRLGAEARMNTPGRAEANWSWRYDPQMLTSHLIQDLSHLTKLYQR